MFCLNRREFFRGPRLDAYRRSACTSARDHSADRKKLEWEKAEGRQVGAAGARTSRGGWPSASLHRRCPLNYPRGHGRDDLAVSCMTAHGPTQASDR